MRKWQKIFGVLLILAMIAVLRSGAAYVPLDAEYPESRFQRVVADANLGLILALGSVPLEPTQAIPVWDLEPSPQGTRIPAGKEKPGGRGRSTARPAKTGDEGRVSLTTRRSRSSTRFRVACGSGRPYVLSRIRRFTA